MTPKLEHLTWTVHPARDEPVRGVLAAAVILAFLGMVYAGLHSLGYCLIGAVALFLALQPFFTPTTYTLTPEGIRVRTILGTQRRSWEEFRAFRRTQGQIILCTRKVATSLDRFRGCRLVLRMNDADVTAFLESMELVER